MDRLDSFGVEEMSKETYAEKYATIIENANARDAPALLKEMKNLNY